MTRRTGVIVVVGLLVSLLLAGVVSSWASDKPDGLEQVATTHGMESDTQDHDAPFSGYASDGISNSRWSTALAGIAGVTVTFGVFGGLTLMLRRRTSASEPGE
jgi:hypothetical protein